MFCLQFPHLYLGITTVSPEEWREDGEQPDVRFMPNTWSLVTHSGFTSGQCAQTGYVASCKDWEDRIGTRTELSAGDVLSMTLCDDRSVSITFHNVVIQHVFNDLTNNIKSTGVIPCLPDKPIWAVIQPIVKSLEVLQASMNILLFCHSMHSGFNILMYIQFEITI